MFVKAAIGLPVRSAYGLADMAADGMALLDHLGIGRAHIVGASMGGMIAQHIAARHAERELTLTSIMSTTDHRRLPPDSMVAIRVHANRPLRGNPEHPIAYPEDARRLHDHPGTPPAENKRASRGAP